MQTKLIQIEDLHSPAAQTALAEAGAQIRAGHLVAFPTETVYGLGANALDEAACAGIFAAKGRPADNPLIVHIAAAEQLGQLAQPTPLALRLAEACWPGPLTLVLPKRPVIPEIVSAGLATVGLRWPAHAVAQALICAAGRPIAAPSANLSGRPSPTQAAHVLEDMGGKLPLILDGGPVEIGLESTVVDACGENPVILRPGRLDAAQLEAACGRTVSYAGADAAARPAAPGMKYRHYAPSGEVWLAAGPEEALVLRRFLVEKQGQEPLLILCSRADLVLPQQAKAFFIATAGDLEAYARNLFAALRYADSADFQALIIETVPETGLGLAIMNRLRKAAGIL